MDEEPLRAGLRLDRYELLCPVAQGGMAAVWLAQLRGKRGFEKVFAIKTIKTELTEDARFQEMFLDEARIASGIEHPNVSHIVDLGEQGSVLYIVMEWVDGDSLATISRLARKKGTPLPLGLALRIMADACAGLHAAHELKDAKGETLGVVHRDVSPHNILVATSGAVKVIDFGVAKARNRRAGQTAEGVVKGKIRYMAPEQVKNENVDRRADVWAIGVCLHELATGTMPFDGESDLDIVRRLIDEDAAPKISTDVPDVVREILEHSIARDPSERFSTANAMRRALENAIVKLGLEARGDDVAEFLENVVPELAEKRRALVKRALADVGARASLHSVSDEVDVAFAPTVVGPQSSDASKAKTRPMQVQSARAVLAGKEESGATRTSFVDDEEVAGLPKNRGIYALALVVALGAGAWFVWPGKARIREMLPGGTPATTAAAPVEPSASVSPTASASSLATEPIMTPDAQAPLDAAPSASTVATTRPVPTVSTATTTATTSASATATPTATVTVTPTATATEEDPGPY